MEKLSTSISIPVEMERERLLDEYRVDSLVTVELRNWLGKKLNADVAMFELLGGPTFSSVGMLAAGRSLCRNKTWAEEA